MRLVLIVRLVLIAGIVLAARAAFAQSPPAARCDVRILRAPDKVKATIEARVRTERRCETSLVLRVVPTETGLYLLASTPGGQTYETVASDPQAASDLVVQWAGRREPRPAILLAPPPTAPPAVTASPADMDLRVRRPSPPERAAAVQLPDRATEVHETRAGSTRTRGSRRWLSLGGVLGDDVFGARGSIDVLGRGGWSAGIGLEVSAMRMTFDQPAGPAGPAGGALLDFKDARAVATLGYTFGRGSWQVRVQAGAGVVSSRVVGFLKDGGAMTPIAHDGVYPIGEAELQIMRMLGARWAFAAGPMMTVYSQSFRLDASNMLIGRRDLDLSLAAGLRRKL